MTLEQLQEKMGKEAFDALHNHVEGSAKRVAAKFWDLFQENATKAFPERRRSEYLPAVRTIAVRMFEIGYVNGYYNAVVDGFTVEEEEIEPNE